MTRTVLFFLSSLPLITAQAVSANDFEVSCAALNQTCLAQNQSRLESGDAAAQYWMGRYQFYHWSDFDTAYDWYQRAALQGYAPAKRALALYHLRGAGGLETNISLAFTLLIQASEQGDAKAYFLLDKLDKKSALVVLNSRS
ncbi:sel1 repeat family protein [Corallincola holothuriorum]|uniref:Sel1 repeat family protein n=1 Tax=Corallincola holothuriorum TaxID=2282215 RepID=A0A368NNY8_9GAMM|nr:SEL1-like repeat protein [Corallincola holothuriorum]RCU51820.1 sel1 repeat family protein [Corallincola holothuriorum]